MKLKGIMTKALLGIGLAFILVFGIAPQAGAQTVVTVDFDALDTSGGPVSGTPLDNYLAAFGITLTSVTGVPAPPDPVTVNADVNNGGTGNVVASSPPNILEQSVTDTANSYTLVFVEPLTSFSFTRAGRCTPLSFPDWQSVAKDSSGTTLSTKSEVDGITFELVVRLPHR